MCNLSEGIAEEAREKGFKDGEDVTTTRHLKNVMRKTHMTLDEAMDMLGVPEEERSQYTGLVQEL